MLNSRIIGGNLMISSKYRSEDHPDIDPIMVQSLVEAMGTAMESACIPDVTSPGEVLSATFTLLGRVLRGIQRSSLPQHRQHNTAQIQGILAELMMEFSGTTH